MDTFLKMFQTLVTPSQLEILNPEQALIEL